MSRAVRDSGSDSTSSPVSFRRATGSLRQPAAHRLVEASAPNDPNAGARFLHVAELNGIDLSQLWITMHDRERRIREACLCVPGAGRTGMFFMGRPADAARERELTSLIEHVCKRVRRRTVLAQALLAADEAPVERALVAAGFRQIGPLSYLQRPTPVSASEIEARDVPSELACDPWQPGDDPDLKIALEGSYIDTLDCPELCGLRSMDDVIASHRATGSSDEDTWWIIRKAGRPVGAMLFNIMSEQSAIELVYMGLSPEIRGGGVGSALLSQGLRALAGRPERVVTCAVDQRNDPARRLYARFGFMETGMRMACIRDLRSR